MAPAVVPGELESVARWRYPADPGRQQRFLDSNRGMALMVDPRYFGNWEVPYRLTEQDLLTSGYHRDGALWLTEEEGERLAILARLEYLETLVRRLERWAPAYLEPFDRKPAKPGCFSEPVVSAKHEARHRWAHVAAPRLRALLNQAQTALVLALELDDLTSAREREQWTTARWDAVRVPLLRLERALAEARRPHARQRAHAAKFRSGRKPGAVRTTLTELERALTEILADDPSLSGPAVWEALRRGAGRRWPAVAFVGRLPRLAGERVRWKNAAGSVHSNTRLYVLNGKPLKRARRALGIILRHRPAHGPTRP